MKKSNAPAGARTPFQKWVDKYQGLFYLIPWIIGFLVFKAFPFGQSLYYSFTDMNFFKDGTSFVGLANYITAFHARKITKARTYKRHYRLGDAVLARVHLDVYLTDGHDDVNSGDSATDILDIEHHRHHEVVHRGQRVRSPAIVHAAAFGKSRVGEREAQRT